MTSISLQEFKGKARSRYWSRWSALAATILSSCFAGLGYAFGLYSGTMQDNLGYSQESIDMIASFGELGMWSTFLVGLLLEVMSPSSLFMTGAVLGCIGIYYVALAINLTIPSSVVSVAASMYLANFGIASVLATGQATCLRNFPVVDRGKISGIFKSILGLSSAIFALLLEGLTGSDHVIAFLYSIGILFPTAAILSAIPMNVIPQNHLSYLTELSQGVLPSLSHFLWWYGGLVGIIILSIVLEAADVSFPCPMYGIAAILYIVSIIVIPRKYGKVLLKVKEDFSDQLFKEREPLLSTKSDELEPVELQNVEVEDIVKTVDPELALEGDNGVNFKQAVMDIRFWCLLLAFMCGAGSGLVVINNISSIGDSLDVSASSLLVSIIGLCNAGGRLSAGWMSDKLVAAGFPRATTLCFNLVFSAMVSILLSFGVPSMLYLGTALAGIAYGSMFSVVLAVAGDCFGTRHIATIYGLLDLGPASGSFLFATWLVNMFYGSDSECYGKSCFAATFIVCSLSTLVTSLIVFVVLVRPGLKLRREELRRVGTRGTVSI